LTFPFFRVVYFHPARGHVVVDPKDELPTTKPGRECGKKSKKKDTTASLFGPSRDYSPPKSSDCCSDEARGGAGWKKKPAEKKNHIPWSNPGAKNFLRRRHKKKKVCS
jgi:hypothetical protein